MFFVLRLLINKFISDLRIFFSSLINKRNEKRKKWKEKENKEKKVGFEHCERIEFGSVGVWNYFHAWFLLIPHCSSISFGSLATYPYVPYLIPNPVTTLKSPSDLDLHVFWLFILGACQVYLMLVFQGFFESKQQARYFSDTMHILWGYVAFNLLFQLSENLTCFELLRWYLWISCSFDSLCVRCVSICLFRVCLFVSLSNFYLFCLCSPCSTLLCFAFLVFS